MNMPAVSVFVENERMKRFKAFLRQPELMALLFILGGLAFFYPVLLMLEAAPPRTTMLAVYLPWGLITLALIFIGRASFADSSSPEATSQDEGGRDG